MICDREWLRLRESAEEEKEQPEQEHSRCTKTPTDFTRLPPVSLLPPSLRATRLQCRIQQQSPQPRTPPRLVIPMPVSSKLPTSFSILRSVMTHNYRPHQVHFRGRGTYMRALVSKDASLNSLIAMFPGHASRSAGRPQLAAIQREDVRGAWIVSGSVGEVAARSVLMRILVHRHQDLLKGIYDMGFSKPSKIQERALPLLLANP